MVTIEDEPTYDPVTGHRTTFGAEWSKICPPLYRKTDIARLKIRREIVEEIMAWEPNPRGIGLSGESGTGKTRLMFLLLRRLNSERRRILATSGKRFEFWCHRMFDKEDDAQKQIDAARGVAILFIDDVGKEKYTERVESEFYDLVEHRIANLMPILWTTNATGEQLERMLGPDRGAPIIRRLREFTEIISV